MVTHLAEAKSTRYPHQVVVVELDAYLIGTSLAVDQGGTIDPLQTQSPVAVTLSKPSFSPRYFAHSSLTEPNAMPQLLTAPHFRWVIRLSPPQFGAIPQGNRVDLNVKAILRMYRLLHLRSDMTMWASLDIGETSPHPRYRYLIRHCS